MPTEIYSFSRFRQQVAAAGQHDASVAVWRGYALVANPLIGLMLAFSGVTAFAQSGDPSTSIDQQQTAAAPARQLRMTSEPHAFRFGFHVDTEAVSDVWGGQRRGNAYDTLIHMALAMDTGPLGMWEGGRLMVSGVKIDSDQPSTAYIGDIQGVSNIAAHSGSRLFQAWYRQTFSNGVQGRIGLIDLSNYFDVTEFAGNLLNASFGITPTITSNVPTSTFPKPGLGAIASVAKAGWDFRAGIFQSQPKDRGNFLRNGNMAIAEISNGDSDGSHGPSCTFGVWVYRQHASAEEIASDKGAYAVLEQELFRRGSRRFGAFLQLGSSPGLANPVPHYLGGGVSLAGVFEERPMDTLDFGFARAWVHDGNPETTYELTYLMALSRRLYLQPDLQFISRPGGSGTMPDAVVGILRLHLELY